MLIPRRRKFGRSSCLSHTTYRQAHYVDTVEAEKGTRARSHAAFKALEPVSRFSFTETFVFFFFFLPFLVLVHPPMSFFFFLTVAFCQHLHLIFPDDSEIQQITVQARIKSRCGLMMSPRRTARSITHQQVIKAATIMCPSYGPMCQHTSYPPPTGAAHSVQPRVHLAYSTEWVA